MTIANMTLEELKRLVVELILEQQRKTSAVLELEFDEDDEPDPRNLAQVFADIEAQRWTPPHGSPTSLELLRQDRDS